MTMRRKTISSLSTQHTLLVIWGEYARSIGVIDRIMKVPIKEKKRVHSAQRKVLELLVATLAGLPYLQDISNSAHPLDRDTAVAEAWGQTQWANYSGVSRTLQSLSMDNVKQLVEGLQEVSQPFIAQEVALALEQEGRLIYDGDLTGLPVSKSSTTYPEVAYGHMDDIIRLGYQAALVSLKSPTYGRLWLSIAHHPGNTISSHQAMALVQAAEASTKRRPRRRLELLEQRLKEFKTEEQALQKHLEEHQQRLAKAQTELLGVQQQRVELEQKLAEMEQVYQATNRPERTHSQLAKLRQRVQAYQKRSLLREKAIAQAAHLCEWSLNRVQEHQAEQNKLQERWQQFEQDNATNPNPIQAVFRLDAGFGTWENITWLIEMGYDVYTKVFNRMNILALHESLADPQAWQLVGVDAEMQSYPAHSADKLAYPTDVGLVRFHVGKEQLKSGVLLHYGSDLVTTDNKTWFSFYNQRQTIEAGIKEGKAVFYLHHFKVRSLPAIALQDVFVIFAANFIRWASVWIKQNCSGSAVDDLDQRQVGTKRLVHVLAHTSGEVSRSADIGLVKFSSLSCLANKELRFPCQTHQAKIQSRKVLFFDGFRRFAQWLHNS
jgi:hypothetical protein